MYRLQPCAPRNPIKQVAECAGWRVRSNAQIAAQLNCLTLYRWRHAARCPLSCCGTKLHLYHPLNIVPYFVPPTLGSHTNTHARHPLAIREESVFKMHSFRSLSACFAHSDRLRFVSLAAVYSVISLVPI